MRQAPSMVAVPEPPALRAKKALAA